MTLRPAWAVRGGTADDSTARALAFAATGGQYGAGIAEWPHLKVTANGTSSVQIAPGAAALPTRYSSAVTFESYIVSNDSTESVAVPATSSGGSATRYVIVRVDDPNFGGQEPPNRATASFSRFEVVSSIINLPYPFLVLAKITQPASTSLITGTMIEDMRVMSAERVKPFRRSVHPTGTVALTTAWATTGTVDVPVPSWATHLDVVATFHGGQISGAPAVGAVTAVFAGFALNDTPVDLNPPGTATERWSTGAAERRAIAAQFRGTTQLFQFRARKTSGAGNLYVNTGTAQICDILFMELPS